MGKNVPEGAVRGELRPDEIMEAENQEDHGGQDCEREIYLVDDVPRLRHQEFQCKGARAEDKADEEGLEGRIVQAHQDNRHNCQCDKPICKSSESSHFSTKIGKNAGGCKVALIGVLYGLIVYFISLIIRVIQKPRI